MLDVTTNYFITQHFLLWLVNGLLPLNLCYACCDLSSAECNTISSINVHQHIPSKIIDFAYFHDTRLELYTCLEFPALPIVS